MHALRVDLRAPHVSLFVTPDNGDAELDTDGRTTASFLKRYRVQAAINASPFRPVVMWPAAQDVLGLSVSGGDLYSPAHGNYHAVLIGPGNRVRFARPPFDLDGVEHAAGGFGMVLVDGRIVGADDALHPRTAIGVGADGRWCYLMVIDGRQPGYSEGVTTAELGAWMRRLGCDDALNLDGGGSTAMVIEGDDGEPRTLNRPINAGIPGLQRIVANHIGVRAVYGGAEE